jgi:hypothetical protein
MRDSSTTTAMPSRARHLRACAPLLALVVLCACSSSTPSKAPPAGGKRVAIADASQQPSHATGGPNDAGSPKPQDASSRNIDASAPDASKADAHTLDAGDAHATTADAGNPDAGDSGAATAAGSPLLVGVGNWGLRGRSADGAAWDYCGNLSTGNDHSPDLLRNVGYGDGVLVAVGGDANSMVMRSLDGVHWQEDLHPTSSCAGESYPPSCQNWMGGVAYGGGTWLAGGGNGALMRSRDGGLTWTGLHPQPTPNAIRDLAYGDGRFVAGTDQGVVLVSRDEGDSWTAHALWTYDTQIAYGAGVFIAWGAHWNGSAFDRGCFVGKSSGDSWSACAPRHVADATSFAHDGTQWVAAIAGGYATSTDAVTWTEHTAANVPGLLLFDSQRWLGRQGTEVWQGTSLDTWQRVATNVPDFRAWTAARVLDRNLPVTSPPACQDKR